VDGTQVGLEDRRRDGKDLDGREPIPVYLKLYACIVQRFRKTQVGCKSCLFPKLTMVTSHLHS